MLQCHPCRQLHLEWLPLTHCSCGSLRTWWTCGHQGQGIAGRTVSPPAPTPSTSTCTAPAAPGQTLLSSCKGEVVLKFCTPVCPTHTHTHTHTTARPAEGRQYSTVAMNHDTCSTHQRSPPHPTPSCRCKAVRNCCNILHAVHIRTTNMPPVLQR